MILRRFHDWPERLARHLQTSAALPFAWGVHDCALAACRAIEVVTGTDPAAHLRGTYKSRAGAMAVVRREGGTFEGLVERLASANGMPEIRVALARRADLVLLDTEIGPALATVAMDGMTAIAASIKGRSIVPLAQCRRAWRVG